MAISLRLNLRLRTTVATATGLFRYARGDTVSTHEGFSGLDGSLLTDGLLLLDPAISPSCTPAPNAGGLPAGRAPHPAGLASPCVADYHSPMAEREVRYSLGAAQSVLAETFGQPGQRTFRLVAEAGRAQSFIWLEKEQLLQLGVYLKQAIEQLADTEPSADSTPSEAPWTGDPIEQDFRARAMQLQYDRDANCFLLQAFEGDEDDPDAGAQTSVSFWMTVSQVSSLADEALRICAAGRPPCFLCGMPIDPDGHRCARANGNGVYETG